MRVTNVVHQYPPDYYTGTEQYAHAVARRLSESGVEVDVYALDPDFRDYVPLWRDRHELVDGVAVTKRGFWAGIDADWEKLEHYNALMGEAFARHLDAVRPHVVHFYHLRLLGANLVDRALEAGAKVVISLMDFWWLCPRIIMMHRSGRSCGGPTMNDADCVACHSPQLGDADSVASHVAVEMEELCRVAPDAQGPSRGPLSPGFRARGRSDYLMSRLSKANAVVAPTRYIRDVYVRNGLQAQSVHQLPYGVDINFCRSGPKHGERPLTFGFFGTLCEHKGPHLIVEAMARVVGECRLKIWGRAADFPAYSRPLLELAARDARVAVAEGFPRDALAEILASIDVLVVPSMWHENSPFVVLEARAARIPVIASDFGGLSEVVSPEVDGCVFRAGDIGHLAACMQRFVDDPSLHDRLRATVRPPLELSEAITEFRDLYRRVVSSGECGVSGSRGRARSATVPLTGACVPAGLAGAVDECAKKLASAVNENRRLRASLQDSEDAVVDLSCQIDGLLAQLRRLRQDLGALGSQRSTS